MNKTLLLIFLLLTPGIAFADPSAKADRPNIIFLFADDQRADTIGAHGNPHIQTPNLDRLAANGFSFRRNYCAGSFSGAVCVASRAMLMTGRHWMNLPDNKPASNWGDSTALPALLTDRGQYNSFIIGKWHNGRGTLEKAFSQGRSIYMGGMANHADFQVQDLADGKLSPKRDAGGFSSTVFADEAVKFIRTAGSEQPFFLYVAFMAPHDPRNPPEEYRRHYYENRPPLPANFLPQHPFRNAPQATSGRDESLAPWPRTKEVISDQLCEYYGLVTHLDEQVGRILTALKQSKHAGNTLVIYTADHGLAMGSHGLLGKQNVYEQSMRCPLILNGPGIPKGKASNSFTYIHDLYATICEFADIDAPDGIDSQSLTPIISGRAGSIRKSLFLPFQDNQRAVRDGQWKLHVYPKINHRLLFDLSSDPHEMRNLAADPDHKADVERMQALMESWRTGLDDPYPLSVENPEPKEPRYDNSERVLDVWQPKWIRDKYFGGRDNANHGKPAREKPRSAPTKPAGSTAAAAEKPNVIIIFTDDQGSVDMNIYGSTDLTTPNMDRLARQGVRFTQFYAAGPVCVPSRMGLLTGRIPQYGGLEASVPLGLQVMIAEEMKKAGYATAHIGKWHLGRAKQTLPSGQGFDYSFGHLNGCIDSRGHQGTSRYRQPARGLRDRTAWGPLEQGPTGKTPK